MAKARSVADLCERMEAAGTWLRLDARVQPTMFHGATVSAAELERVRGIAEVVRMGRVLALEPGRMRLQGGDVACAKRTLFIDCTASALARNCHDRTPVFRPGRIDLQLVRVVLMAQSMALIAGVEAHLDDEAEKNRLTAPTPMIDTVEDWVDRQATTFRNQAALAAHPTLMKWFNACRLNPIAAMLASIAPEDVQAVALRERFRALSREVMANIERLSQTLGPQAATPP